MPLLPKRPHEALIFKLSTIGLRSSQKASSDILHAAEKEGKVPQRFPGAKRERLIKPALRALNHQLLQYS